MKENYVEVDSLRHEIDNQELSGNTVAGFRMSAVDRMNKIGE